MAEILRDPDFEWLDMLQPTGLVVGRNLLRELGLVPERQTKVQSAEAETFIEADTDKPALKDPWGFVCTVLGWESRHVAGSPEGPPLPDTLMVRLPEHETTLSPSGAVSELGGNGAQPWQLLVRIETGIDPDKRRGRAEPLESRLQGIAHDRLGEAPRRVMAAGAAALVGRLQNWGAGRGLVLYR
jgi:hypothetical protein